MHIVKLTKFEVNHKEIRLQNCPFFLGSGCTSRI